MVRNNMCFYNRLSTAKLKIYKKLGQKLEKHGETNEGISLCVPGCTDCCHDYFTVQSTEFDLILNELSTWDEEKLNNLIGRVDKYWNKLESEHPEVSRLLISSNDSEIEEINSSIDKTSFPCVFLDDTTGLCQIYDIRPFKCRIFGNSYYYPQTGEGAIGIACKKYERVLNEDNFDIFLCDVTEILNENTDLAIIQDKKRNAALLAPEYPLIFNLYKHLVLNK
jgi:Fe-S-cluster containining protein